MVLLKGGANPNCFTPDGRTLLQAACGQSGSSKFARELIARGANVAARSLVNNDTALHAVATAARSDLIQVLLEKGADVNARDNKMNTPLHDACRQQLDTETMQQEEDENPFEVRRRLYGRKKANELSRSIVLLLTLGQADPKAKDMRGATPFHYAIKARNPLTVETLIRHSPSIIYETDSKGRLPIHWAAELGFTNALYYLVDTGSPLWSELEFRHKDERKSLMKAMSDSVNVVDSFGNTALHGAARGGHEKFIVELLSLSRAVLDFSIRNRKGYTALDLAKKNHHVWVASVLKEGAG
jgi:ankyrin repeat protein